MTTKDEALKAALEALTCNDDDIDDPGHRCGCCDDYVDRNGHVRAAIREALAQKDEQEPVAEITADDMGRPFNAIRIGAHFYKEIPPVGTKLYTAPPRRTQIDKRVKVKLGTQYGDALAGNWFYLQPADDYADQALFQHTGVEHDTP